MPLDVEEECRKDGAGRPPLAESEPRGLVTIASVIWLRRSRLGTRPEFNPDATVPRPGHLTPAPPSRCSWPPPLPTPLAGCHVSPSHCSLTRTVPGGHRSSRRLLNSFRMSQNSIKPNIQCFGSRTHISSDQQPRVTEGNRVDWV